jgi:hypothetical protein
LSADSLASSGCTHKEALTHAALLSQNLISKTSRPTEKYDLAFLGFEG